MNEALSKYLVAHFYCECQRGEASRMCRALELCPNYCHCGSYGTCDYDYCDDAWERYVLDQEKVLEKRCETEGELAIAYDLESALWKDWMSIPCEMTDEDYEWDDGDDGGDYV